MLQFILLSYHHPKQKKLVSIHLMLQFIDVRSANQESDREVSIHLMLQFILLPLPDSVLILRFNTSHVVVYPEAQRKAVYRYEFQYISCCSLSTIQFFSQLFRIVSIHLMLQFIFFQLVSGTQQGKFQYISCCSLS